MQNQLHALNKRLQDIGQSHPEKWKQVFEQFCLNYTFHSCALDGNTLRKQEVVYLLKEQCTPGGRPLRDCLDIVGHYQLSLQTLQANLPDSHPHLTIEALKKAHQFMMNRDYAPPREVTEGLWRTQSLNIGNWRTFSLTHVDERSGEPKQFVEPEKIEIEVEKMVNWINETLSSWGKQSSQSYTEAGAREIVTTAVQVHDWCWYIHPFSTANGRFARWLANWVLVQAGYFPVILSRSHQPDYVLHVNQIQNPFPQLRWSEPAWDAVFKTYLAQLGHFVETDPAFPQLLSSLKELGSSADLPDNPAEIGLDFNKFSSDSLEFIKKLIETIAILYNNFHRLRPYCYRIKWFTILEADLKMPILANYIMENSTQSDIIFYLEGFFASPSQYTHFQFYWDWVQSFESDTDVLELIVSFYGEDSRLCPSFKNLAYCITAKQSPDNSPFLLARTLFRDMIQTLVEFAEDQRKLPV